MTAASYVLKAEHLRVDFGGLQALDIARLEIPAEGPAAVLLMGPNGAGKTTFLDTVSGWVQPRKGARILFRSLDDEVDMTRASRVQRVRAGIVRTFQRPPVFGSLTVKESIVLAARGSHAWDLRSPRTTALVETLVDVLGVGDLLARTAGALPLHVLRRVELVRALATEPRLLFLDEPTAGSDDDERGRLSQFLSTTVSALVGQLHTAGRYRFQRLTSCIVTHDMKLAAMLSNGLMPEPIVYILSQGRLYASGSLVEMTQEAALRSSYFGGQ